MKKIKKVLAMLLAFTMILGLSMTAMADDGNDNIVGTYDDLGVIEIKGIDAETNINVEAYKIIEAKYDVTTGNFDGYEILYPDAGIDLDDRDMFGNVLVTWDDLNKIIAAVKVTDVNTTINDEVFTYDRTYTLTAVDGYYRANVQVGTYLVMITDAEGAIYNPVVVSVNYLNKDGETIIYDGAVNVEEIHGVVDGQAWVKKSNLPGFSKVGYDVNGNKDGEGNVNEVPGLGYGNSVNVGSEVEYTLTIDQIPFYGGEYPVFNVVDTMEKGLDYVDGSLTVEVFDETGAKFVDLVEDEDYTLELDVLTEGEHALTIDFVLVETTDNQTTRLYTLNDYQGKTIVIKYQVKLNEYATLNEIPNINTAELDYTIDSKINRDDKIKEITDKTYTYSFDLTDKLLKVDENNNPLANAYFELYTDETCETKYENDLTNGEYKTSANGKIAFSGLEAGTYYLKETKAPAGYSVNTHIYKIEITAEYDTDVNNGVEDGTLIKWEVKVDDAEGPIEKLQIPNTKLINLPSTGGIGTTIFTVAGCMIMIAAAAMFIVSRKKEAK